MQEKYQESIIRLVDRELAKGAEFSFTVSGKSMGPFLKAGDRVVAKKVHFSQLRCGDIIVFQKKNELYTHRLLKIVQTEAGFVLIAKGDSSFVLDDPVPEDEFVGKVVSYERAYATTNLVATPGAGRRIIGMLSYCEGSIYQYLRLLKRRFCNKEPLNVSS